MHMDEELRIALTIMGRILYYMGKKGVDRAKVSELRTKISPGVYQILISGVKKGVWEYDINKDEIKLTEKGKRLAQRLSCL